jgi:hypothetical protein
LEDDQDSDPEDDSDAQVYMDEEDSDPEIKKLA